MTDPKLTELLRKVAESTPYTADMAHVDGAHDTDPQWFAPLCPQCAALQRFRAALAAL